MRKRQTYRRKPRARRKGQSLLVLHLDADRLRADGLHLGDIAQFASALSSSSSGRPAVLESTTSRDDLHETLARHASAKSTFDVIVIVAHSNAAGVRIAEDLFVEWDAFAGYLKPFKPRRLLLVACKAGCSNAGEMLFSRLPQLRRIFACPVNASKDFGALMMFAVPYIVAERRPKDKHVAWSHVAAIAATGRQLREWRRTTDVGNPDNVLFDLIADVVDPVARAVPASLKDVLR